jgi:DNA-binding LacI/PurR family transcriptional regulator
MLTSKQLAEMLQTVNAEDVAKLADVSVKTIYRLRNMKNSPSLATAERLVAAVNALRPRPTRRASEAG